MPRHPSVSVQVEHARQPRPTQHADTRHAERMGHTTIKGVELLRAGTWQASTGEVSITGDDLNDMLEAWRSLRLPLAVIKIGHTDPRMENPDWDGEPAYGQVDNLSVSDDDGTPVLSGDFINVPDELAEKLPSAYPQRSVEIDWSVELRDEDGEVVETYRAVLTAVALLGATPPAVKGLADVHAKFKQRASSLSVHHAGVKTALSVRMAFPGGHTDESLRQALSDALRDSAPEGAFVFVEDFDDTTVWFSAEQLDEAGGLGMQTYQQDYTTSEEGVVSLTGEPIRVQVRRTYQPIPQNDSGADDDDVELSSVPHGSAVPGNAKSVDARRQKTEASSDNDEGEPMEFTEQQLQVLREKFGLPEDATNDDVLEAINAAHDDADSDADSTDESQSAEGADDADSDAEGADDAQQVREPVAAGESPATVTLSHTQFSQMQDTLRKQGAALAEITAERDKERRDKAVQTALASGRIHPTDVEHWRSELDKNEAGTTDLLSKLTPVFPTTELGSDQAAMFMEADEPINAQIAELDDQYFGKGGK